MSGVRHERKPRLHRIQNKDTASDAAGKKSSTKATNHKPAQNDIVHPWNDTRAQLERLGGPVLMILARAADGGGILGRGG